MLQIVCSSVRAKISKTLLNLLMSNSVNYDINICLFHHYNHGRNIIN